MTDKSSTTERIAGGTMTKLEGGGAMTEQGYADTSGRERKLIGQELEMRYWILKLRRSDGYRPVG